MVKRSESLEYDPRIHASRSSPLVHVMQQHTASGLANHAARAT